MKKRGMIEQSMTLYENKRLAEATTHTIPSHVHLQDEQQKQQEQQRFREDVLSNRLAAS